MRGDQVTKEVCVHEIVLNIHRFKVFLQEYLMSSSCGPLAIRAMGHCWS